MSVKDDFLNGLKDFAKDVGSGIWGLITDWSKRAIRETLFPSPISSDIQVILNNTPKEEVPLLPLRPDTEPFLSSSLEHLSWGDWFIGEAGGNVHGRVVRIKLPDGLRLLGLGDEEFLRAKQQYP